MAIDPLSAGMIGLSAFQGYQQYEAGREAKATYYEQAKEIKRQTAFAQRMSLEEMKALDVEGQSAVGEVKAAAGKSGVRVAGSVTTLMDKILTKVDRRKGLINMQFQETARQGRFRAAQYRKSGRAAARAGKYQAFGSLLTGGVMAANRQYQTGKWPFGTGGTVTSHGDLFTGSSRILG